MVRRLAGSKVRTELDRVEQLNASIEELYRRSSRGSTALRDAANNLVEMRSDAMFPLLTASARGEQLDVAIGFRPDGTLVLVDREGGQGRGLEASTVTATGLVVAPAMQVTDLLQANRLAVGSVSATAVTSGTFRTGTNFFDGYQLAMGLGPIFAGDGNFQRLFGVLQGNSDARVKRRVQETDPAAMLAAVRSLRWPSFEYVPQPDQLEGRPDGERYRMAIAQEVLEQPELADVVRHPENDEDGVLRIDLGSMTGALGAAVAGAGDQLAEQEQTIRELRDENAQLRADLAALTQRVETLEAARG